MALTLYRSSSVRFRNIASTSSPISGARTHHYGKVDCRIDARTQSEPAIAVGIETGEADSGEADSGEADSGEADSA